MVKIKKGVDFQKVTIETLNKFNQKDYINEYIKSTYKAYHFRLRHDKDAEIIKHIESVENKNEYFKKLVLADMVKKK